MAMNGGCLCGKLRYHVTSDTSRVFLCYCRQCQKAQGTAFVASVPVAVADFHLMSGAECLKSYRSSPSKARYFCGDCGSPLYSQVDGKPTLRLRAGSLDASPALKIQAHIHTADIASWYQINDTHPRYSEQEPGRA